MQPIERIPESTASTNGLICEISRYLFGDTNFISFNNHQLPIPIPAEKFSLAVAYADLLADPILVTLKHLELLKKNFTKEEVTEISEFVLNTLNKPQSMKSLKKKIDLVFLEQPEELLATA
jgi:hypothetical protein